MLRSLVFLLLEVAVGSKIPTILWGQKPDRLYLSFPLKDVREPEVELEERRLYFKGISQGHQYEVDLKLLRGINVSTSKYDMGEKAVSFDLPKLANEPCWKRLTRSKKMQAFIKKDNQRLYPEECYRQMLQWREAYFYRKLHREALLRFRGEHCDGVQFLEGHVTHGRSLEAKHSFRYGVRMALIDLDRPPPWWSAEPIRRLTAQEVREAAGTRGNVKLLTSPAAAQYHQNPIQIYFCEDNGEFHVGVCEVTNTPWNHHVFFVFRLEGDERPKPLHVSPLMDLKHRWFVKATSPAALQKGTQMEVSVDVLPGLEGTSEAIFKAHLKLELSNFPHARAEHAGSLRMLWDFGFQPQRTALRIYWNALKLLRKGVAFRSHPSPQYKEEVLEATQRSGATKPWWRDNQRFPWNR